MKSDVTLRQEMLNGVEVLHSRASRLTPSTDAEAGKEPRNAFLMVHDTINDADHVLSDRLRQQAIRDAEWRKRMRALNMNTAMILDMSKFLMLETDDQSHARKAVETIDSTARHIQELLLGLATIESE